MTVSGLATPYGFQSFPNYTAGRQGNSINKIVIHHMATTDYNSVPGIWNSRQASAHYGIGQDGTIRSYVDEDNTAWHAGDWPTNLTSIGIEHANATGAPNYDIAQATIDASAKLVADIANRYGLGTVVPYKNLFPHSQFTSTACPGQLKGKLQEIADRANAINNGGQSVPTQSTTNAQPTSTGSSAIDKFKAGGDRFVLQGSFINNTCELQYGIYQSRADELSAVPFAWKDNGIPTKLLDDLSDPNGRSFNDGATVRFKPQYQRGTIDKYSVNANAVGIDFLDGNGIIWFDADKFWAHY
ncbi:N-acetylmuramoyl-L-alanine amidase [Fructobacillus tropaeoli]|uniref:peptidoglycan recognition protein family protein n=1 Tax=Fructobacillus tropaeoli TaxID=709323 RepID=UPI001455DCD7|nr:peptidoglycan recognition family protein [Fructobacillus tropaeoli]NLS38709.1 N-acetylmuramoyl-L-alanine amidase [Fructobacillus tropaeoli]